MNQEPSITPLMLPIVQISLLGHFRIASVYDDIGLGYYLPSRQVLDAVAVGMTRSMKHDPTLSGVKGAASLYIAPVPASQIVDQHHCC